MSDTLAMLQLTQKTNKDLKKNKTQNINPNQNIKKRNYILIFSSIVILIFLYFYGINFIDEYYIFLLILIFVSIFLSILISEFIILIWTYFYFNEKVKTDFTPNFMGIFVIILPLIIFAYYFNY
jgi:hypothetical protein